MPVAEVSVTCVNGYGLLVFAVVCSNDAREVLLLLTSTKPNVVCVVSKKVVSLSRVAVVSVMCVNRHGLLVFTVVSSNDGYEVVVLSLTSAELNVVCVGGQGVVSLSPLEEDVSVICVNGHGLLVFAVVCSNVRYKVVLLTLTSAELNVVCVEAKKVVLVSSVTEDVSVMCVSRHGLLVFEVVWSNAR